MMCASEMIQISSMMAIKRPLKHICYLLKNQKPLPRLQSVLVNNAENGILAPLPEERIDCIIISHGFYTLHFLTDFALLGRECSPGHTTST